mmetsp:Transcript_14055/g.43523  ORF Transcript_14055/g.43523 Transcript_14055/m.43523 type:complete len:284 (-) Transcript_14055:45-896(-)
MAARLAEACGVPADMHAAFEELFTALTEAAGGKAPSEKDLAGWRKQLQQARAESTVRAFMAAHSAHIEAPLRSLEEAGANAEKLRRACEQRLVFMGVYGTELSLEETLARLLRELEQQCEQLPSKAGGPAQSFFLAQGSYDKRHAEIRAAAYPYTPACCASHGSDVVNCFCAETERLAGYIAMHGSYADDLSVHPSFHGRGVAKALACGVAKQMQKEGSEEMSLDVRACNLPAIQLYKSLGFQVARKKYPIFYDWHGGYSMVASTAEVSSHMPQQDFDHSRLG